MLCRTRKLRDNVKTARRINGMHQSRGRLEEEPRQYYRALMQGAHAMYRSSVEKSTKRTYKTAERRWVKLTKRIETDPYMCNPATDKSTYCITWILRRYVQHARPGPRLPFFHIPKFRWTLKPTYLNKRMQAIAIMYGLNPNRVSSHSLRIGGANVK